MGVSKVTYFGNSLFDLTADTVTPETLAVGTTAHDAKGDLIMGTLSTTLFAIISVTYPVGSTCTCTNGTKTLKAPDPGGKALFNVPSTGTWTVSCTDGADTASRDVVITADRQIESVELSYRLYLFNDRVVEGISWDEVKKDKWNYGTLTIGDTIELFASSYWDANYFVTAGIGTAIDLSNFSTLKAHVVKDEGEGNAKIYVGTEVLSDDTVEQKIPIGSSGEIISVDISSLSGRYFIALNAAGTSSGTLKSRRIGYDVIYLE